jgi:hypothetical protein
MYLMQHARQNKPCHCEKPAWDAWLWGRRGNRILYRGALFLCGCHATLAMTYVHIVAFNS